MHIQSERLVTEPENYTVYAASPFDLSRGDASMARASKRTPIVCAISIIGGDLRAIASKLLSCEHFCDE